MEFKLPTPSPKQELFLMDEHRHVNFGGARGGGKSFGIRLKAVILALLFSGISSGLWALPFSVVMLSPRRDCSSARASTSSLYLPCGSPQVSFLCILTTLLPRTSLPR